MNPSISQVEFNAEFISGDMRFTVLDVRKPGALRKSGQTIPGAAWHHPFAAAEWAGQFTGRSVVVFCVHGHEVSRAVAGFLRDEGCHARFLEGGFEGWLSAGGAFSQVEPGQ
jgi:rhodanese-related sulfurtransferase